MQSHVISSARIVHILKEVRSLQYTLILKMGSDLIDSYRVKCVNSSELMDSRVASRPPSNSKTSTRQLVDRSMMVKRMTRWLDVTKGLLNCRFHHSVRLMETTPMQVSNVFCPFLLWLSTITWKHAKCVWVSFEL